MNKNLLNLYDNTSICLKKPWPNNPIDGEWNKLEEDFQASCLSFTNIGNLLAIGNKNGIIHIWDVSTLHILVGILDPFDEDNFSNDLKLNHGMNRTFNNNNEVIKVSWSATNYTISAIYREKGKTVAHSIWRILIWHINKRQVIHMFRLENPINHLSFHPFHENNLLISCQNKKGLIIHLDKINDLDFIEFIDIKLSNANNKPIHTTFKKQNNKKNLITQIENIETNDILLCIPDLIDDNNKNIHVNYVSEYGKTSKYIYICTSSNEFIIHKAIQPYTFIARMTFQGIGMSIPCYFHVHPNETNWILPTSKGIRTYELTLEENDGCMDNNQLFWNIKEGKIYSHGAVSEPWAFCRYNDNGEYLLATVSYRFLHPGEKSIYIWTINNTITCIDSNKNDINDMNLPEDISSDEDDLTDFLTKKDERQNKDQIQQKKSNINRRDKEHVFSKIGLKDGIDCMEWQSQKPCIVFISTLGDVYVLEEHYNPNWPGIMYPPGYELIDENTYYIEPEDEFDEIIENNIKENMSQDNEYIDIINGSKCYLDQTKYLPYIEPKPIPTFELYTDTDDESIFGSHLNNKKTKV